MKRKTDPDDAPTRFRAGRVCCENGRWFFSTREGPIMGPFDSKEDAEAELAAYVLHQKKLENFGPKPGDPDFSGEADAPSDARPHKTT
ncbi:MAG: DUF6316 family protein [Gammaproteobacteria bacterium]|nr:DUF6316 family protein [Gammaproteobacteria bacterium]